VAEPVSVLLPLRDEAGRVEPTLRSLLAQRGLDRLEIVVLDDGSSDGTADVVRGIVADDPRVRLLDGGSAPPPDGWLGKPWACARLADAATGTVLVFVDADVVLEPDAIAGTVALLRDAGLDLVSPYPRQLAVTPVERLVQPLVVWSWLTTLPLGAVEGSPRPSLAAANGQLLAVDTAAYRIVGGHGAVRREVLEDIALLRAFKRIGFRGCPADGSDIASCRMYEGAAEVVAGYTKSLWSAFGSAPGAAAVTGLLGLAYVVPPVLAVTSGDPRTRATGLGGYAAAVLGRVLVARRTGERAWPDALAHPASIAAFGALTLTSLRRHRRGSLTWKGRPVA
jgi:Glycosyl transferase family 2